MKIKSEHVNKIRTCQTCPTGTQTNQHDQNHNLPGGGDKWNESGFRPPLCTYRLNWARITSWGWWDDWDDTVLQTQDSKFEPWRSEAEHATSRSRRLPTILTFTRGWGRNNFVSFKPPTPGTELRTLAWKAAVLTTTLGPPPGGGDNWYEHCRRVKMTQQQTATFLYKPDAQVVVYFPVPVFI